VERLEEVEHLFDLPQVERKGDICTEHVMFKSLLAHQNGF